MSVELLTAALVLAFEMHDAHDRARLLCALASVPDRERRLVSMDEVLRLNRVIDDRPTAGHTSESLARCLAPSRALAALSRIPTGAVRVHALTRLARDLPPALLPEAAKLARGVAGPVGRALALASLAQHTDSPERNRLIEEALANAHRIDEPDEGVSVLGEILPHLPVVAREGVAHDTLVALQQVENTYTRLSRLRDLVEHLPDAALDEALVSARSMAGHSDRAWALAYIASARSGDVRQSILAEALGAARSIDSPLGRARAMMAVARGLPGEEQAEAMREALAAAREVDFYYNCVLLLREVAPYLPESLLEEALAMVRDIEVEDSRIETLAAYLPRLSPADRVAVTEEELATARAMPSAVNRLSPLVALLPHIWPDEQASAFEEAFDAARKYGRGMPLSRDLVKLLPYAPAGQAAPLLEFTLQVTSALDFAPDRTRVFHDVRAAWLTLPRQDAYRLWTATIHACATRPRPELLSDLAVLAPVIASLGGEASVLEALAAVEDVEGRWP